MSDLSEARKAINRQKQIKMNAKGQTYVLESRKLKRLKRTFMKRFNPFL